MDKKQKKREYDRIWNKSEKGKKSQRISQWRTKGILCFDWNLLYSYYVKQTTCEFCDKPFTTQKDRHLDHNHEIKDRFNVRGVLCMDCNTKDKLNV